MKGKRHTPAQVVAKLRDAEAALAKGASIAQVCKQLGVSEHTYYRWRKQYGQMSQDEAKRLKGSGAGEREAEADRGRPDDGHRHLEGAAPKKMVSPSSRRRAVMFCQKNRGYSQRRACRLIGQPRMTQRYDEKSRSGDDRLTRRLLQLARKHPKWGYRTMTTIVQGEGWNVNRKRVYRLWVEAGLRVSPRRRRKRGRRSQDASCAVRRPERVNHVWSYDVVFDETTDGRRLKWLTVVDEHSRFNLALEVKLHFKGSDVIGVLDRLFREYGAPEFIRSDNRSEFVSKDVQTWLTKRGVTTLFVAPGSPWQNGYVESFNGTLRAELLDREEFANVLEAQMLAAQWRDEHNHLRPHSSMGGKTPAEFRKSARSALATARRSNDLEVAQDLGTPSLTTGIS